MKARLHHDTGVGGNTGPQLSSLLSDGAGDGRALHLTLGVDNLWCCVSMSSVGIQLPCPSLLLWWLPSGSYRSSGGTHNTSVVLEVEEDTVCALPGLGLANDDSGVDLLAELRLALLDGGHTVKSLVSAICFLGADVHVVGWWIEAGA